MSYFDDAAPDHASARRSLWLSVIRTAFADALHTTGAPNSDRMAERDRAGRWLLSDSRDFRDVCELAGLCPKQVRQRYLALRAKRDASEAT